MADQTNSLVAGLFGLDPYQIQQQRNQQAQDYAAKVAGMDGFEAAKFGIGQGAAGLTRGVAGMMGMVDPMEQEAQQQKAVMQGADTSTPEGLMAIAKRFNDAGMPQQAAMAMQAARQMKAEKDKAMQEQAKTDLASRRQDFQETEAFALKKMQAEAVIRQNDERIADRRTSDADRNALLRDNNEIKRMLIASKSGAINTKEQEKLTAQNAAKENVSTTIAQLRDSYEQLQKGGGITDPGKSTISNIYAGVNSSGAGQAVGRLFGTQNQSKRNEILMTRPSLLAHIMKATGMSAKQMDSNTELKLWLSTATDPTLDISANMKALDNIERVYGTGNVATDKPASVGADQYEYRTLPNGKVQRRLKNG